MNDLNLARKWRPKNFEQIIGQDMSVRMLKNSLYLKKYFPVYLFAGLRGCGKTSTARVFGAAVNCKNLTKFQENPSSTSIPCLECDSCLAMSNGAHPDFIEIDAASHTGVDNVRQIVDSSSYMPLMGQKKIYLIDEAHMLSKAAFNAFLKLLEEPPTSVLFILATTETSKVPATVLSRCFQVIFTPIQDTPLKDHLKNICQNENVTIDDSAIELLLAETEGSARDAINLLERVRFSGNKITEETLLQVLGKVSTKELCLLFESALDKNPTILLSQLQQMNFEKISATNLWDMLINLGRALLWVKYDKTDFKSGFNQNIDQIKDLAGKCSLTRLHAILQLMWTQEALFLRTSKKHAFLEMVLLQICEQTNIADLKDIVAALKSRPSPNTQSAQFIAEPKIERRVASLPQSVIQSTPTPVKQSSELNEGSLSVNTNINQDWQKCIQLIAQNGDLMLNSILSQAKFIEFNEEKKVIRLQLNNNSNFFKDKIADTKPTWINILSQSFNECTGFEFVDLTSNAQPRPVQAPIRKPIIDDASIQINKMQYPKSENIDKRYNIEAINIQDKAKWPNANLLISYFPGKITKNG